MFNYIVYVYTYII